MSPDRWPAKAKEAPSPYEERMVLLDTKPVFQYLGVETILLRQTNIHIFTLK